MIVSEAPAPSGAATATEPPALSVVLVTPAGYDEIRATLRQLVAQSIAGRIELLVVTPDAGRLVLPVEVSAAFHSVRVVPVPDLRSLATAKATAVPHATAPIVAFSEDHSFPEPGWAAAMLAGHARGYGGVAPEMKNANPASVLSWVAMFLHFGSSIEPAGGCESDYPAASHNMSYRRDALLELGPELGRRLLAEGFLHDALRARGHRLWLEPTAATRHVNMSYLRPLIQHAWTGGRLYGGLRYTFGQWSLARRLFYTAASPLIPLLRLQRTIREIRRAGYTGRMLPGALGPMIAILIVHAAGEATGYVLGLGSAEPEYSAMEVGRDRFVLPSDRSLWA